MKAKTYPITLLLLFLPVLALGQSALVLQSDFGVKDGAVASMKGVAFAVDAELKIFDLTHEIPPFNIWQAAYRLVQTAPYWPSGTVFVSVVDPGVGTARKSVVMRSKTGHLFVTPDNGTLTLVAEKMGIAAVRIIDESRHRRKGSAQSHTFHGRDVYALTGAKLAAGKIDFAQVGPVLETEIVRLPFPRARLADGAVHGMIAILDVQFGNLWTNIGADLWRDLHVRAGDSCRVQIARDDQLMLKEVMPFASTFGDVPVGAPLLYLNSLQNVSVALNQGSFAEKHHIGAGPLWRIHIQPLR